MSKPTVSIIGAGRLGHALGLALHAADYSIAAVVTKTASHAKNAAASISLSTLPLAAEQLERLPPSDIVLLCTPDDVVELLAKQLAKLGARKNTAYLHTSGALSSAVLAPLANKGFTTGSMHPLVSISDPIIGANIFRGAFFCVESETEALEVGRSIVRDLGGSSFTIPAGKKALYHAAAVMASPHLVSLIDLAMEVLMACGVKPKRAQNILLPLIESTASNLKASDSGHALTGTFARGDLATVQRHLEALSPKKFAAAREIYKLLGVHSLDLAKKNGLDPKLAGKIKKVLRAK